MLVFMQSIMPLLSSNLSIENRGIFLGNFNRKFEKYMKPRFLRETGRFDKGVFEKLSATGKFNIYLSWVTDFFSNLGFDVDIQSDEEGWLITLRECSWCERNYENIFYCLICQAILKQTLAGLKWTEA